MHNDKTAIYDAETVKDLLAVLNHLPASMKVRIWENDRLYKLATIMPHSERGTVEFAKSSVPDPGITDLTGEIYLTD